MERFFSSPAENIKQRGDIEVMKSKISVCYIVKNEAQNLPVSLASIKATADEIVVVDTGSADNTKVVAQSYGAQIYDYSWQDDFAAARNFALDKLTGDWVVFLDGDEYFSEETMGNIRRVIEAQGEDVNLLLIQRQDVDEERKVMLSIYVPRIFRCRADFRYTGAIHEELRQNGQVITGIVTVPPKSLNLLHTGYAGAQGTSKAQRNLRILQKEMEKTSDPGHFYGYLAEAYDGMDERENAMKYAYMDIARGRQAETYASRSYRLLLAKLSEQKRDYQERQRVAKLALQDYPELPEFHAEFAESLASGWEFEKAAAEMAQAIRIGKDYHGLEPTAFNDNMAQIWQKRQMEFAELADAARKIKISACVITKNEETNIDAWLENASAYANECVVLDTGSEDNTCTLAEQGGARVYHYEWQDDFAAARNEALKHVYGDWVAFMDADEFFAHSEQVRGLLAECEKLHPQTEAVRLTICNVDADDGMREISRFCNIRLFRNREHLRYLGRVHENLTNLQGGVLSILEEPCIMVMHTGYSTGIIQAKAQRNLALLQQDMTEQGEQPQHYRYLSDCYYSLGEYRQAEIYALKAIDAPLKGHGTHGDMYYRVLNCMEALRESEDEQLNFARAAHKQFPQVPDFSAVIGKLYQEAGNYEMGEKYLLQSLELAQNSTGCESTSFGDIEALTYAKLADCEAHLGKQAAALQHSEQALKINPYEEEALLVFCVLRQEQNIMEELPHYFTDSEQDTSFLCRFSERNGLGMLYEHCCELLEKRYGRKTPRWAYYKLLREGNWEQLLDKLQAGLTANFDLSFNLLLRLWRKQGKTYRETERQLMDLLPAEVQNCLEDITQGNEPENWSIYKNLWPYFLKYGDSEQTAEYVQISLDKPEIWPGMIDDMLKQEKWTAAFKVLAQVPQELADGIFWQNLGRCLYHLQEYPAAHEAFSKARQAGMDTPLLKSYEVWLMSHISYQ